MVGTRDRHRKIVSTHLDDGEVLQALINVNDGSPGAGPTSAITVTSRYRADHDIAERGLHGIFDLFDCWLALTDRRLLVFRGATITLSPKPKALATTVDRDAVRLAWRDATSVRPFRLLHLTFPDDEVMVRMGEVDEESDRFVAALGDQARPLDPPSE